MNPTIEDSVTHGDCMIGSSGKLYTVDELKSDLLNLNCSSLTVKLDMCRHEIGSRGGSGSNIHPVDSIRKVELR